MFLKLDKFLNTCNLIEKIQNNLKFVTFTWKQLNFIDDLL